MEEENPFVDAVRHAEAAIERLRPLFETDPRPHVVGFSIGPGGVPSTAVLCAPEAFASFDDVSSLSATCDRKAGVPVLIFDAVRNHVAVYVHKFPWSDPPMFCRNCGSCDHEKEACAVKRGSVELHVPR